MKNDVHVGVYRIIVAAVLSTVVGVTGANAQGNMDAEFQKLGDAFAEAWGKADAKGIAALHTKDAVRLAGNGQPAVIGTAALEKGFAEALAGPYKGTTLTIKANPSTRVSAETYIGEGTYQVTGGTPPAGTPMSGQYMNTLVRQGGRWLIAASAVIPAMPPK